MKLSRLVKHLNFVGNPKSNEILIILSNGFFSLLLCFLYLFARSSLKNSVSKENVLYIYLPIIFCFLLFYVFYCSLHKYIDQNQLVLFRILRFTLIDYYAYILLYSTANIFFSVFLTTIIVFDFSNINCILIVLCCLAIHLLLIFLYSFSRYHNLKKNKVRNKIHSIRFHNKLCAYIITTYFKSDNWFSICLCPLLAVVVIIGSSYFKLPFNLMLYVLFWILTCGMSDLAQSDENNYLLNILLKYNVNQMVKTKILHYISLSMFFGIISLILYVTFNPQHSLVELFISFVVLYIYCCLAAISYIINVYSYYPNICNSGNNLLFIILLYVIPGIGLIFAIATLINIKKRKKNNVNHR